MEVEVPPAVVLAGASQADPDVPTPPTDASEAPPNTRLSMLKAIFTKCLQYGLREPSVMAMASHFPGLPEAVVHSLCDLYKQVLSHIEVHSMAEFSDICNEYCMDTKLAELERLQEATQSATAARPAASLAKAAEAAAWTQAKQQEVCELQNLLAEASKRRSQLQQVVTQRHALVQELVSQYNKAVADVQQVYLASQGQDVQAAAPMALTPVR